LVQVFRALWPEALRDNNSSVTTINEMKLGEEIAIKSRMFVVVREANNFCTCL
jgi:hypothetical protein